MDRLVNGNVRKIQAVCPPDGIGIAIASGMELFHQRVRIDPCGGRDSRQFGNEDNRWRLQHPEGVALSPIEPADFLKRLGFTPAPFDGFIELWKVMREGKR